MDAEPSVLIHVVLIVFSVLVFGPLAVGMILVIRDTIRKRGKWGINLTPNPCRQCGTPAPMIRKPANWRQAMWGGWTCSECGLEVDKWSRSVEEQSPGKWAALRAVEEIDEREHPPQRRDERIQNVNDQTQQGDAS